MSESFQNYHKIETLYDRKGDFSVDSNKIRKSVYCTISPWDVTEKIDGMNIRVMIDVDGKVRFGGRSNSAQLPTDLYQFLYEKFSPENMKKLWITGEPTKVILFGEGYGAGIQKGGGYRLDKSFMLFDVLVADKWWLEQENVIKVAGSLGCNIVPYLGMMTLEQITELCRVGFTTKVIGGSCKAEGIVARPIETLFDKNGDRLVIKLKTKDFLGGKR
jgi:hypothetical protein